MARSRRPLAVALLAASILVLLVGATFSAKVDDATNKKEKGNGKGNNGNGNGNGNGKGKGLLLDRASTHYVILDPNPMTGQERFFCLARGSCHWNTIECPAECPQRNRVNKGCFADCSSRCEATCKCKLISLLLSLLFLCLFASGSHLSVFEEVYSGTGFVVVRLL